MVSRIPVGILLLTLRIVMLNLNRNKNHTFVSLMENENLVNLLKLFSLWVGPSKAIS